MATTTVAEGERVVEIPDDYYQVTKGICKRGDMFFNLFALKWEEVENEDINAPVKHYDAIIRKKRETNERC